jgi:hypothetical protein
VGCFCCAYHYRVTIVLLIPMTSFIREQIMLRSAGAAFRTLVKAAGTYVVTHMFYKSSVLFGYLLIDLQWPGTQARSIIRSSEPILCITC